jgi:Fe-Mn family superoxide dismutase
MDRQQFLSRSLKVTMGTFLAGPILAASAGCSTPEPADSGGAEGSPEPMPPAAPLVLAQVALPYAYNALEPSIDAQTMEIHYTKHHTGYVKKANAAILEEGINVKDEAELVANVGKYSTGIRNNVGGAVNHNLFWEVMAPGGTGMPDGKVLDAINAGFGDFEMFKTAFTEAGMKRFGSGWAWLVEQDGKLAIGSTANQDNPLMDVSDFKGKPLLALDVWEHAYYLKYQNKRNEYVENWWKVVNWANVAKRMG